MLQITDKGIVIDQLSDIHQRLADGFKRIYGEDINLDAILNLDTISRPVGVQYKYIVVNSDHPFGWASDPNSFGFGNGKFTRILNVNHE